MRIETLYQLTEWKCNAPIILENPASKFTVNAYTQLRESFKKRNLAIILAEREEQRITLPAQDMQNVLWECSRLEPNGWRVLVVEWGQPEFGGYITLWETGGEFCVQPTHVEPYGFVESIKEPQHRHIVREVERQFRPHISKPIRVSYFWATEFMGINFSRLVVYDYEVV